MSGLIGIPCNDSSRFSETYASITGLHLPESWTRLPNGNTRMPVLQCRFASLAYSLNYIGRIFLQTPFEWLFLLNDDHVYPPDTLLKLLSHDKDIVTGVYLKKTKPFEPILYDNKIGEDGKLVPKLFKEYEGGLVPIAACGDGCLLIRRKVLETIPQPWWEMTSPETPDLITQDLIFCKKVREAGFQMWADLDALIGHIALVPVAPRRVNGHWTTVLISGQGGVEGQADGIELPAAYIDATETVET